MIYKKISSLYKNNPFPGKLISYLDNPKKLASKTYLKIAKFTLFGNHNVNRIYSQYSLGLKKNPKLIFDIGCGTGEHTCLLALAFPKSKIVGVDLTQKSISYAKKLKDYLNLDNLIFVNDDVKNLKKIKEFKNPDLIIMSGSLHHFPNPRKILKLCFNNLNKGGYIIFGVYGRLFEHEKYISDLIKNSKQLNTINKVKKMISSLELDRNQSVIKMKKEKPILRVITSLLQFDLSYVGYIIFPHSKNSSDLDGYTNPIVEYYNPRKINELTKNIKYKKIEYVLPKIKFEENRFYKKMTNYEKFLFCDAKSYISVYRLKLWN
jgi:ubiquinone/menaquinone biosynthesis C-methylase UbiE